MRLLVLELQIVNRLPIELKLYIFINNNICERGGNLEAMTSAQSANAIGRQCTFVDFRYVVVRFGIIFKIKESNKWKQKIYRIRQTQLPTTFNNETIVKNIIYIL